MRKRRACDACRQRKIQCDGDAAGSTRQCDWCSNHDEACTFHGVKQRDKTRRKQVNSSLRPNPEFNEALSMRLEHVNNTLTQNLTRKTRVQPVFTTSDTSTACPSKEVHSISTQASTNFCAGRLLGQNRCHTGFPFLTEEGEEWIQSRTGEKADLRKPTARHKGQRAQRPTLSHLCIQGVTDHLCALPKRSVVEDFLDAFHKSAVRLIYPVVDCTLFQETIAVAYEPWEKTPSLKQTTAKACVLAFLSMMGIFQSRLTFLPPVDWDACADMAHSFLPYIIDEASLESLQTALMLHLRQTYYGRSESSVMCHAIACQVVFMLGGHINADIKSFGAELTHQERETRHLRILFWHCYIFDKDISLRTGRPPSISDNYCDLTLPEGYIESHFMVAPPGDDIFSSFFANDSLVPFLPGEVRLSRLKDKTYRLLYSAQALAKSDAEVIRAILELDDELESWRLSIPKVFRPALSISDPNHQVPELKLPQRMQHIALHLQYHYLMVTIHRASARCFANDPDIVHDANEHGTGISSSMAICLEASRSTLFYLRAAIDGLAGESFWIIVFYPTAATMTLFLHVLAKPLAPQAKMDLELLSSAADLIRNMPIQRLTPYEIGHIQTVNDFITELIRLGDCAISKARGNGNRGI